MGSLSLLQQIFFGVINKEEVEVWGRILLLFIWANRIWQFDLWFCAFSKSSLNIWTFMDHTLLKPSLENFERYFASLSDEYSWVEVWNSVALSFFGIRMKTDFSQSCGHCWVFHICWHIERSTFTAVSFRILNSWTGILSRPTSFVHHDAA